MNENIPKKSKRSFLKIFFILQCAFVFILFPTWYLSLFALEDSVKERLVANAQAASLAYDGDVLEEIDSGEHPSFKKVQKINLRLESMHPDIRFVYTMRKNKMDQVTFLVDAISIDRDGDGAIGEDEKAAAFGEVYKKPTKEMLKAFYIASADGNPNTDRWGTFISGYAPIYNERSEVVAIVGLDMDIDTFRSKQDHLSLAFLVGAAISFAMSLVLSFYLSRKAV